VNQTESDGNKPAQIDFPPLWFLVRGAQVLVTIFFAKTIYLARGSTDFVLDAVSAVGVILLVAALLRRIATGTADSSGIHYRVYFKEKRLAWEEVQAIEWVGFRLRAMIKEASKRKRRVVFLLNPVKSLGAYWAHRLGAEVVPPEILERMRDLPIDTPPKVTSAPLYSKWLLRAFLGLVAFFVLVVIWRLLLPGPRGSH
jgi:hypothetical protein